MLISSVCRRWATPSAMLTTLLILGMLALGLGFASASSSGREGHRVPPGIVMGGPGANGGTRNSAAAADVKRRAFHFARCGAFKLAVVAPGNGRKWPNCLSWFWNGPRKCFRCVAFRVP